MSTTNKLIMSSSKLGNLQFVETRDLQTIIYSSLVEDIHNTNSFLENTNLHNLYHIEDLIIAL